MCFFTIDLTCPGHLTCVHLTGFVFLHRKLGLVWVCRVFFCHRRRFSIRLQLFLRHLVPIFCIFLNPIFSLGLRLRRSLPRYSHSCYGLISHSRFIRTSLEINVDISFLQLIFPVPSAFSSFKESFPPCTHTRQEILSLSL